MRPEDFEKIFGAAFDKIEPKDDAHRQKLAKMRDRIKAINAETLTEMAHIQEQVKQMNAINRDAGAVEAARERQKIAEEATHAMSISFTQQAEQIREIAEKTARRAH